MTLPEILLWQALRKQTTGLKFRKQHPAGRYVLDFYCASAKLAVEVDGQMHATPEQVDHDLRRDAWLASWGVRVLRISAATILGDLANVIDAVVAHASLDHPLHRPADGPPPRSGEDLKEAP